MYFTIIIFNFFIFQFFITPLIFIFKTYYYLAKKDPIFKANFIFFYNFCDFFFFFWYCSFESLTSTLDF